MWVIYLVYIKFVKYTVYKYSIQLISCAERQRFRFLQKMTHKPRKPNAHAGLVWVIANDPQMTHSLKLTQN